MPRLWLQPTPQRCQQLVALDCSCQERYSLSGTGAAALNDSVGSFQLPAPCNTGSMPGQCRYDRAQPIPALPASGGDNNTNATMVHMHKNPARTGRLVCRNVAIHGRQRLVVTTTKCKAIRKAEVWFCWRCVGTMTGTCIPQKRFRAIKTWARW